MNFDERLEHLIPEDRITEFSRRWQVRELALFGSVLRDDFGPESDVDVLISFADKVPWSLWDLTTMEDELSALVGRKVDLEGRPAQPLPSRTDSRYPTDHLCRHLMMIADRRGLRGNSDLVVAISPRHRVINKYRLNLFASRPVGRQA